MSLPGTDGTGPGTPEYVSAGCPSDLWLQYQTLKKSESTGRAQWWKYWEYVLYRPGDLRDGVPCEAWEIKFCHKPCGCEYKPSNASQTATKHVCKKVLVVSCQ